VVWGRGGQIAHVLLGIRPREGHVFCEKTEDREQARECPTTADFVQEMVAIEIAIGPCATRFSIFSRLGGMSIHLNKSVNDAIEVLVPIELEGVPSNQASSLQMPG